MMMHPAEIILRGLMRSSAMFFCSSPANTIIPMENDEFFAMPNRTRIRWDRTGLFDTNIDGTVMRRCKGTIIIKWDDQDDEDGEHPNHPNDPGVGEIVQNATIIP